MEVLVLVTTYSKLKALHIHIAALAENYTQIHWLSLAFTHAGWLLNNL